MKRLWIAIAAALLLTAAAASADPLPINQLPMYGGRQKTEEMKNADADFIASMEKRGLSRAEGAKQALGRGWAAWGKKDMTTAMARFNQAWLLDPENGNVYHGFALIMADRDGTTSEVERLFRVATSKQKVDAEVFVDYGKFLWMQKRLDESQAELNKALRISPMARNARAHMAFVHYLKNDFASACTWAREARINGDALEAGFPEDMCRRADKPDEGKPAFPARPPA
ncbi:tetratricopeptide repeat protein [Variovorax boronicumulans]